MVLPMALSYALASALNERSGKSSPIEGQGQYLPSGQVLSEPVPGSFRLSKLLESGLQPI